MKETKDIQDQRMDTLVECFYAQAEVVKGNLTCGIISNMSSH